MEETECGHLFRSRKVAEPSSYMQDHAGREGALTPLIEMADPNGDLQKQYNTRGGASTFNHTY